MVLVTDRVAVMARRWAARDTSVWAQSRGCAQTDGSKGYYSAVRFPDTRSHRF